MSKKVVLITGASSGIGKDTAIVLQREGYQVFAAARRVERMEDLKKHGIKVVSLDVTKEESMIACVEWIRKQAGRIDVLINNAGYGYYGAVEDVTIEEARKQLEVNLFGLARMTQLVLPMMRKQQSGKIINISSMAGRVSTPFGAWYHATKYAVEGFSDCLRMETKPFGIDVVLIEPGAIKTDWGIIAADHLEESSAKGAYAAQAKRVVNYLRQSYNSDSISKPEVISNAIRKAVLSKKPKTRYLIGYGAKLSVCIKRVVSDRMFDKIIQKIMSK
ncbi:oxidoreductase [Anaerosporobacter faecicola]|uniref:oxidoreductase n=1 Tax=Anaerosporobacter faecicola TaxID=2718714 RepID=UPI00143B4EAF|nr:oxidoreductase [Anaerosporobacter faecicola]